ncbi:MAG: acetyl-CoA carboxylase carboxyl transferase subunit alpha, partial [Chloroflexota bacterium]|nr:acetyl-CoA carboxylase carboxyl transferase subunit alpha [Chloroflexota bacterium]
MKALDFEQPFLELERRVAEAQKQAVKGDARARERLADLEQERDKVMAAIYRHLQPWQKVQLARHPDRLHL